MKQSEALDMITKLQLAHQAMESACKRIDELKAENKQLKEALAKQKQDDPVAKDDADIYAFWARNKESEQPKPVAHVHPNLLVFAGDKNYGEIHADENVGRPTFVNLYTTPQPKQEQGEPLCWITPDGEGWRMRFDQPVNDVPLGWTALFDKPQQRTSAEGEDTRRAWVGLTDEEIRSVEFDHIRRRDYARAIEAKLKEKNT